MDVTLGALALGLVLGAAGGWTAGARRAYRHGFEDGLDMAEADTTGWLDTLGPFGAEFGGTEKPLPNSGKSSDSPSSDPCSYTGV